MDVSTVSSQTAALTAYTTQLASGERKEPPSSSDTERRPESSEGASQRSEQVTLSSESRRLAEQAVASNVQPAGESADRTVVQPSQPAQSPQEVRSANAKSVAQAINAYLETSIV